MSAQYKDGRGRFETHDSVYAAPATPAIGQYETAVNIGSSKSSTVSYATAKEGRFEGRDTIYAKPATPGIGEYETAVPFNIGSSKSSTISYAKARPHAHSQLRTTTEAMAIVGGAANPTAEHPCPVIAQHVAVTHLEAVIAIGGRCGSPKNGLP